MKKLIAISVVALTVAASNLFAQGTIAFLNNSATLVRLDASAAAVFGVAANSPVPKYNATTAPFVAGLYYGAGSTAPTTLAKTANFSAFSAGTFNGGTTTLTGVGENAPVNLQVKVWESTYGATYEAALGAGMINGRNGVVGQSAVWNMLAGNATTVPNLASGGFQGFTTSVVPEPSTFALGLLGLVGLFVLRRRQ